MTKREAKIRAIGEAVGLLDCQLDSGRFLYQSEDKLLTEEDKEKIDLEMDALIDGLRKRLQKLKN